MRDAFEAGRGCYGYRRVHAELRRRGTRVSEKVYLIVSVLRVRAR